MSEVTEWSTMSISLIHFCFLLDLFPDHHCKSSTTPNWLYLSQQQCPLTNRFCTAQLGHCGACKKTESNRLEPVLLWAALWWCLTLSTCAIWPSWMALCKWRCSAVASKPRKVDPHIGRTAMCAMQLYQSICNAVALLSANKMTMVDWMIGV